MNPVYPAITFPTAKHPKRGQSLKYDNMNVFIKRIRLDSIRLDNFCGATKSNDVINSDF